MLRLFLGLSNSEIAVKFVPGWNGFINASFLISQDSNPHGSQQEYFSLAIPTLIIVMVGIITYFQNDKLG